MIDVNFFKISFLTTNSIIILLFVVITTLL